uniref:Protein kinase domain-containing protein n=1 Tax=Pristionchus pacificus TaxID=54126 RepID=A0A8R1UY40_PRIPA
PGNTLITEANVLKLCDLGVATSRLLVRIPTSLARILGTDLYMSPENNGLCSKYSSKTDVYALGLIFAELCVVMTRTKPGIQIFYNYRRGKQNNIFNGAFHYSAHSLKTGNSTNL